MPLSAKSYSSSKSKRGIFGIIWPFLALCFALDPARSLAQTTLSFSFATRIECVEFNPGSHGQVIYVAPPDSVGLMKSTDGGKTWLHILGGAHPLESGSAYIKQILVLPNDTSVILAASSLPQVGVHRSTNGGYDWYPVLPVAVDGVAMIQLSDHSVYCAESGSAGKLWRSTDLGATWDSVSRIGGQPAVCVIAAKPDDENVFLAGKEKGEIYRSTDRGRSWTLTHEGDSVIGIADVPNLVFDPQNPSIVFATLYEYPGKSLVKSTDAGLTWANLSVPVDQWALELDRSNPQHMWLGRFSGLHRNGAHLLETTNGGATWDSLGFDTVTDIWMIRYDTASGKLAIATSSGLFIIETETSRIFLERAVERFTVYPNPADQAVHISPQRPSSPNITIIDCAGRIVWRSSSGLRGEATIGTTDWPAGIYQLILTERGKPSVGAKFLVLH